MKSFWSRVKNGARLYHQLLSTHPYPTKMTTAAVVLGASDMTAQWIKYKKRQQRSSSSVLSGFEWDSKRTVLMSCYGGILLAPFAHKWFLFLNRTVPAVKPLPRACIQAAADFCIPVPLFMYVFFLWTGFCFGDGIEGVGGGEGEGGRRTNCYSDPGFYSQVIKRANKKVPEMMKSAVVVWPVGVFINYYWIPLLYRVVGLNIISFVWNSYICLVSQSDS